MLVEANATEAKGERSMADELMGTFESYIGRADRTAENREKAKAHAVKSDQTLRRSLGIPVDGEMPEGAYVRATVIGFQIVESSRDEASVWLLSRVTQRSGELAKEDGSYTRNLLAAQWEDGDWKMTAQSQHRAVEAVDGRERPAIVAPGDARFNRAQWAAIRQAS
ncbi:hypothetical protein ACQUSR_27420 [Streptomyces sp. P1-3]|uniref:hypothetical protein n=1 Tax=Streptomyces sp. P1-3 TaxID=3421658 RepID=UPI003D36ED98